MGTEKMWEFRCRFREYEWEARVEESFKGGFGLVMASGYMYVCLTYSYNLEVPVFSDVFLSDL